jgi:hypothetical protein
MEMERMLKQMTIAEQGNTREFATQTYLMELFNSYVYLDNEVTKAVQSYFKVIEGFPEEDFSLKYQKMIQLQHPLLLNLNAASDGFNNFRERLKQEHLLDYIESKIQ